MRLVYAGNLGSGYDLETVIAAVKKDERLSLDIAGKGPKEASLIAMAHSSQATLPVRFHGYLGAEALSKLLGECDIGVIPMRDDSYVALPYKLGDYLAAGLKVVSSLHGECGALIERERLGAVYDFGSVDSLLEAITKTGELGKIKTTIPEELQAEKIYPKYVRYLESRIQPR